MTVRCIACGRFCTPADQAVPWGRSYDTEPPEEVFWCASCAKEAEEWAVAQGYIPDAYWQRPAWAFRAAKRLNLVLAGSRFSTGQDRWCKPEDVPADLQIVWPVDS
jgi:hypothetical protein